MMRITCIAWTCLWLAAGALLTSCAAPDEADTGDMAGNASPEVVVQPEPAPPAETSDPPEGAAQNLSNAGSYLVSYVTHPMPIPMNDMFTIEFWIRPMVIDISEIEKLVVEVDARMPHHHHGMYRVPRVRKLGGTGHYEAQGMLFHMPGYWEIYFDITHEGVTERAQFSVEID